MGHTLRHERLYGLNPTNGTRCLSAKRRTNSFGSRGASYIDVVQDRDTGNAHRHPGEIGGQLFCRALQQLAVKWRTDRQQESAFGTSRLGSNDRALDGLLVPGDHDLAGGVEVYGFDALHLCRFGTRPDHAFVVEPPDGGPRATL